MPNITPKKITLFTGKEVEILRQDVPQNWGEIFENAETTKV